MKDGVPTKPEQASPNTPLITYYNPPTAYSHYGQAWGNTTAATDTVTTYYGYGGTADNGATGTW